MELVSIIMPLYNSEKFIEESINSVLEQTYNNWELIVIDDNSKDNSKGTVNKFCSRDARINLISLKSNSGAAFARQIGIDEARGDYLAFLDSDDKWHPEKLLRQISFMKTFNSTISCTGYQSFSQKKGVERTFLPPKKTDDKRVLYDCPIGNSTVIIDKQKFKSINIPNIRKRNDDALWLSLLRKGGYIDGFKEVLCMYRIGNNSLSSNKLSLVYYHWKLYREFEKMSVLKSLKHILIWIIIKVIKIK